MSRSPSFSQSLNTTEIQDQIEQAESFYREGDFIRAIPLLQKLVTIFQRQADEDSKGKLAIALTNLGNAQLAIGQPENAAASLQQATEVYRELGDAFGVKRSQIYRARSLKELGLFLQACETLTQSLDQDVQVCQTSITSGNNLTELTVPTTNQLSSIEVQGWHSLGEVLRVLGKLEESQKVLEQLVKVLPADAPNRSGIILSLGNTLRAQGNLERDRAAKPRYDYQPWRCGDIDPGKSGIKDEDAKDLYQDAIKQYINAEYSVDIQVKTKAQLNRLSLLLEMIPGQPQKLEEARSLLSNISLTETPKTRWEIYAQINLAKNQACFVQLESRQFTQTIIQEKIVQPLQNATTAARQLSDSQAESYALGNIAGWLEYIGNQSQDKTQSEQWLQQAQKLTEQALYLAQPTVTPDIAYQWQWQLGRLFVVQNDRPQALDAYQAAIDTLNIAREDLLTLNTDVQYSFRDSIEPLYRQYLDLLLQPEASQENLKTAAETIEQLQLTELENFLRCRLINLVSIEDIEQTPAAIIYQISLKNRIDIMINLPAIKGKASEFYHYISVQEKEIGSFRKDISDYLEALKDTEKNEIEPFQKCYQWLIKPIEKHLPSTEGETVVFVLDNDLRGLPISSLHDGEKYLVQKYSISTNLSGKIQNSNNSKFQNSGILIAGIYEEAPSFEKQIGSNLSALPKVKDEISYIQKIFPNSFILENQEFSKTNLNQRVSNMSLPVVHLATHADFNSSPEKTQIYSWFHPINLNELSRILQQRDRIAAESLDLIVFSACETASGDDRAPLGIAGIALRANAKSTLASLWKVSDWSTAEFMEKFYTALKQPGTTKAEALRKAQISFIERQGSQSLPYYWAAFILVGNWL